MRNPNGFGTVQKIGGNRRKPYRVRKTKGWSEEGKQLFETIGYFETRPEAMIALAKFNSDPWDIDGKKSTFAEIFELSDKARKKGHSRNEASFRSAFNYCKSVHEMPIDNIKTMHLQEIIDDMNDKSKALKTKVKQIMNQVFKYALTNDIVVKNPASSVIVKDTIIKEEDLHKPFTNEQLKDMFGTHNFHKKIALILCLTGFRIDEALEIKTENIDFEKGIIIGGKKTKAGTDRTVPISKHILNIIKEYYVEGQKYLFVNTKGTKILYENYRSKFKEIYPDNTTHDGRHTFASLMDSANVNKMTFYKIIGHAGDNITEKIYTHKTVEELKEGISQLDKYVSEIIK